MRFNSRRVFAVLACVCAGALWAGVSLRLEDVTALPETPRLPVGVMATGTGELSAVTVEITFAKADFSFVEAVLDTGLLGSGTTHISISDGNPERATAAITIAPARPAALAEGETRLFDAVFSLGAGLVPGETFPMVFARAARVTLDGQEVQAAVVDGSVTVATGNYLIMEDAWGYPGQSSIPVELKTFNSDALMGMQVGGTFDKDVLSLLEISQRNTMTEALRCEFFQPIINNEEGYFLLGILLEAIPPDDPMKRYPPSGSRLRVARLFFEVNESAQEEQDAALTFVDGLGDPPLNNRVVIDHESRPPLFLNGTFRVGTAPEFIRGEVNGDGRVNIADPVMITLYLFKSYAIDCVKSADVNDNGSVAIDDAVYLLGYLFEYKSAPLPPFPAKGLDPTEDGLSCMGR